MDHQAKIEALEWELIQYGGTAKNWIELARAVNAADHPTSTARINAVSIIFERSLRALPSSYKLWHTYIHYRLEEITGDQCTVHEKFQSMRHLFERSVAQLPNMPMLWVEYIKYVMASPLPRITMCRHLLARSLKALPATQHHHIWVLMKKWTKELYVPSSTVKALWHVYLLFNKAAKERRAYFCLLLDRGDMNHLVLEWLEFFESRYSTVTGTLKESKDDPSVAVLLRHDMWDTIQVAFESKGWIFTGDVSALERMTAFGAKQSTSAIDFMRSFCMFLYGQGLFEQGRTLMWKLLADAPDPSSFTTVFALAVEMEDELAESFAQHSRRPQLTAEETQSIVHTIFGQDCGGSPVFQLRRLAAKHDMLLNQAQLRNLPQSVPLWLKRVEIVQEKNIEGEATREDLTALWRQAIEKCVHGMASVDISVGQLFSSFATFLLSCGCSQEALKVLDEGAWHTNFSNSVVNAHLLGLCVEIQLLSGSQSAKDAALNIVQKIKRASSPTAPRRATWRSGFFAGSQPTSQLHTSPLPWLLALDLFWSCGAVAEALDAVKSFAGSSAYTPESAARVAHALYHRGYMHLAIREFENALELFKKDAAGFFFLLSQYISLLCLHYGEHLPLDMFRELSEVAMREAPRAMGTAPVLTLDVLMSCASIEMVRGLFGHAIRNGRTAAIVAIQYLQEDNAHFPLICGLTEKVVQMGLGCKGMHEARRLSNDFVCAAHGNAALIQRIVLHWAALEKRCGYSHNAHTVMDTYADTQNPDTPAGAPYWEMWEKLCDSVEQFEVLVRRRQQARNSSSSNFHPLPSKNKMNRCYYWLHAFRSLQLSMLQQLKMTGTASPNSLNLLFTFVFFLSAEMWALSKRPIVRSEALLQLSLFKEKNGFDSSIWLLESHTKHLGVQLTSSAEPLQIQAEWLKDGEPCAVPFTILTDKLRKSIVFSTPPPAALKATSLDIQPTGRLYWRPATAEEVLDASLNSTDNQESILLCSSKAVPLSNSCKSVTNSTLSLFNAQQSNNPFALDESLRHSDLLTHKELPSAYWSGLTTVAAQFHYTSFRWLQASALKQPGCIYQVKEGQMPHTLVAEEEVQLLHVFQLSPSRQAKLLARTPRFVLLRGLEKAFVRYDRWWKTASRLCLQGRLSQKDVPSTQRVNRNSPLPLLWFFIAHNLHFHLQLPLLLQKRWTEAPKMIWILHIPTRCSFMDTHFFFSELTARVFRATTYASFSIEE
eukprot:gene9726-6814_t